MNMNTDRKTVHVIPAEGRVVPDPERSDPLPKEARTVVRSSYWARRVKDQDVTEGTAPSEEAEVTTEAATEGDAQADKAAVATKTAKGAK